MVSWKIEIHIKARDPLKKGKMWPHGVRMTNTKRKDESAFKEEHLAKCSALEEGVLRARSGKQMPLDIPLKKKSDDKEIL